MKIIKKWDKNDFKGFDWLNFDSLPKSKGSKFEVYVDISNDVVSDLITAFHILFKDVAGEILISEFRPDGIWGDFCIDTWDLENDMYDYSPDNKQEPTRSYLAMLRDNLIEPEFSGFCKCFDWDKFLYVTLHCVVRHTAPYSMMFYVPQKEFVFYFHHTGSLGIYFQNLNEEVKKIVYKSREHKFIIKNTNDERIVALINTAK